MGDSTPSLEYNLGDRYRFEGVLGQGSMATVFLAHDLRYGRWVALKVLRPELAVVLGRAAAARALAADLDEVAVLR